MFKQNNKLGGYLVAYGVIKKDGQKVEKWLKKPIHNTITKNMLNGLLQFNGDNTLSSAASDSYFLWMKGPNTSSTRTGVINYAAYGTGTGETSVNDNDLKNKTSDYTSNHMSGTWYTGTHVINNDPDNAVYYRVAYQFTASATEQDVKEFGTFHRIEPNGAYKLTARVQLDDTLHLDVGDSPFFIYEIKISYTAIEDPFYIAGIGKYVKKINTIYGSTSPSYLNAPYCSNTNTNFSILNCGLARFASYSTALWTQGNGIVAGHQCVAGIISNITWPNGKTTTSFYPAQANLSMKASREIIVYDYTQDSFYRDCKLTMPEDWASDSDLYGVVFNGDAYQFGDMVDGVFTPSPWHKDYGKELIINARQSYSTDLLTPAG